MKWIGQHIWDFVSRFRNKVVLEDLTESTEEYTIMVKADGELVKSVHPMEKSRLQVRNDEGSTIPAGAPLYSKGEIGGSERIKVGICDANDPAKMPCIGVAEVEMNTTSTKDNFAITQGVYNANISGFSSLSDGEIVYVSSSGSAPYLTQVKPTGEASKIQNVGIVLKTNGTICQGLLVSAIGRANDVPNLNSGYVFYGNGSNQAVSTQLSTLLPPDLTTSGTGTIHPNNVPILNQDTTGTAAKSQNVLGATDADVVIASDGEVVVKLDSDNDEAVQKFKVVNNADTEVASITEDGSLYITSEITNSGSGNDLFINSDGNMLFTIDRDNNESNQKFSFVNYNTEIAKLSEDGNLQIDGDLTVSGNDIKDSNGNSIISSNGSGVVTLAGGNIGFGTSGGSQNYNLNINSGSDIVLEADQNGGGGDSTIQYPDSGGTNRIMLAADNDVVILSNRAANGTVQIRANTSTPGGGGEQTIVTVEDDSVTTSAPLFINAGGPNVAITCTSSDADCMVRVSDDSTAGTNAMGMVGTGDNLVMRNDEGNFKVKMANNATDTLDLDQSGNLTVTGLITGKQRHVMRCGFVGSTTATMWLPFNYGGTFDATSSSGYLEYGGVVMPADGYVESVIIRSENACGNSVVAVNVAGTGTEVPVSSPGSFASGTVNMAVDDTAYKFTGFANQGGTANSFSAGDVVMISFDPTNQSNDTTATAVIVLDWNNAL